MRLHPSTIRSDDDGGTGHLLLDVNGVVVSADRAAARCLDRPESALLGREVTDIFPESVASLLERVQSTGEHASASEDIRPGLAIDLSLREVLRDEKQFFDVSVSPRESSPRTPSYKSRDRLLSMIVEEAANEVYVFDQETRALLLVNRKARRNVGYMQNEICEMSIDDLLSVGDVDRLNDILKQLVATGADELVFSGHHKRRDGSLYAIESSTKIGLLDGRRIVFQIGVDQTAVKRGEERVRQLSELEHMPAEVASPSDIPRRALEWLLNDGKWALGCFVRISASSADQGEVWIGDDVPNWRADEKSALVSMIWAEASKLNACRWSYDFKLGYAGGASVLPSLLLVPLELHKQVVGVFALVASRKLTDEDLLVGSEEVRGLLNKSFERKTTEEELAEARERLEAAVEGADTGLWHYNYRTGKFFLSERAQEILGVSLGHAMPGWAEFGARLHPDDIERTRFAMSRHATHGAPYSIEYRYRLDKGQYIWLQARGRGSWGKDGAILRTAGTLVDITMEKEAEFLRRDITLAMATDADPDEKLSGVLRKAAVYLRMSEGVISHVSDGDCEVLHSTSTDGFWRRGAVHPLKDVICSDVYFGEEVQAYPSLADSPLSAHPARAQMSVEAFIGAPIFVKGVRFGTLCFFSPSPKDAAFSEPKLAIVRLLAQWAGEEIGRAAHLASLLASDAMKAANLASVGDAVLTVNRAGCIEDANPAASALFGWNAESLRRMHIEQLLPGVKAISGPEGELVPVRSRQDVGMRRNGERITVLLHVSDVQLLDRTLSTVVITDLTLVKQAEAAKRDFVSVVSHELRTPLTSIRGALALIGSQTAGPLPPAMASLIQIAKRNSERLVRLVNDILDMDKLEHGKFEVNLRPLSVRSTVQEAVTANTPYAERFGVTLVFSPPEEDIMVIADSDRLLQVMANLLSNAAKFTPSGTSVSVTITQNGGSVQVAVQDRGPGIPENLRPRLFEKFAQGENVNTREREGSGLGLSISRSLMRLMNGDIQYAYEAGVGSTFVISLPSAAMSGRTIPELSAAS